MTEDKVIELISKLSETNERINAIEKKFDIKFLEVEKKLEDITDTLRIFTFFLQNNKGEFKPYLLIISFMAGAITNMVGIYAIIKAFINLVVKIK